MRENILLPEQFCIEYAGIFVPCGFGSSVAIALAAAKSRLRWGSRSPARPLPGASGHVIRSRHELGSGMGICPDGHAARLMERGAIQAKRLQGREEFTLAHADEEIAANACPEDEKLGIGANLAYGLQHVLTMYGGIVAVPLILGQAAGLDTGGIGLLVTASLFAGGLATILQTIGVPFFGSRLPLVQGVSFSGVATMIASGRSDRMASTASSWAMQRLRIARTNAASLCSHSFHHPLSAEKLAAMKISFTGVKCRIHG